MSERDDRIEEQRPTGERPTSIDDALGALVDGQEMDWARALEASAEGVERRQLNALRVLSRVQNLAAADEVMAGSPWGSVEIVEKIGSGGFATVYRALDPVLDLEVALKLLHRRGTKASAEILEEGRRLARVRHPNVVRVFGVEEHAGRIGLRMELIRGRSLDRLVREDGAFGSIEATRIGLDVCRALAAVHGAGLVHRDVKAQNVVRDEDDRIVLMDLGAGSESAESGSDAVSGRGTPLYLAPEILDGGSATTTTDQYALGVLLFFLVSGRFPVEAETLNELRSVHRAARRTSLRAIQESLPEPFVRVVERASHSDPRHRFASINEMARALAAALSAPDGWAEDREPAAGDRSPVGNLPPSFTRFVGRRGDLEALGARLREHRLVTLVGPGGCGKTRMALEMAGNLREGFEDGAWFVSLAPVRDDHDVDRILGTIFGVDEIAGERLLDGVVRALRSRVALVVMDNCEHLSTAVARVVSELLGQTRSLRFVVTSRVALGLSGEAIHPVRPLLVRDLDDGGPGSEPTGFDSASPDSIDEAALQRIARNEAVQLFLDRVAAADRTVTLDATNARAIARICRHVDGLPLALELAAAQVRSIPIAALAERLRERIDLLQSTGAVEPAHHRTLDSSIAWSHALLSPECRRALSCLSVFAGGWTLEAAEAVLPEATALPERAVLGIMTELVGSSLVHLGGTEASEHRYDMLDTVRRFARHRLDESESRVVVMRSFVRYFLELAKRMNRALMGAGDVEAMRVLSAEHDNIRAACRATVELEDLDVAFDLARHLGRFWMTGGFSGEGRSFCGEILRHPSAPGRTVDRAAVAGWFAVFAKIHGDVDEARRRWEESLDIRRERNDRNGVASALNGLGTIEYDAGRLEAAERFYEQSLRIRRDLGEERGIAQSLTNLGLVHAAADDLETAIARIEEARSIHERTGNAFGVAKTLGEIGFLRSRQGRLAEGARLLSTAMRMQADLGPNVALPVRLGYTHLWSGSLEEARSAFDVAMRALEGTAGRSRFSPVLNGLAMVEEKCGNPARAARLLGIASADVTRVRMRWEDVEVTGAEARLRAALGDDVFDAEYAAGRAESWGGDAGRLELGRREGSSGSGRHPRTAG
ncbi:MAG: protein kinase [Candidatus Eisenbacteria bacterium]|uniref:Protein kinase n=1 Tax=Eiseniibacteriota bacterium TaxID=2212470 RepID=A0A956M1B6_UNCEI|nr:protein kinase [Candidatus Eisenbacteria bacterium]